MNFNACTSFSITSISVYDFTAFCTCLLKIVDFFVKTIKFLSAFNWMRYLLITSLFYKHVAVKVVQTYHLDYY